MLVYFLTELSRDFKMLNQGQNFPSAYAEGYAKACQFDQTLADKYIAHTVIGDPVLDAVMEEISSLSNTDMNKYIQAGVEQQETVMRGAPRALLDFFDNLGTPSWLDYSAFTPGIRAFHGNTQHILTAFLTGVLVEGFSTLISKSFYITGRVAQTDRRLMQNNRHLLEIFLPKGLDRQGDGWRLSIRIRFIHARIRRLLEQSDEWRPEAWGKPISAAHLGYAMSVFSLRLLYYSKLLGSTFDKMEEESILSIWRYTGHVMGVPDSVLYTNETEANQIYNIAKLCEPAPGKEAKAMANALVNNAPKVAGITDPSEAQNLINLAHRLSRALLGHQMADQLGFKKSRRWGGVLPLYRMQQRFQRFYTHEQSRRFSNFGQLLEISLYDSAGISYKLPDHVRHAKSGKW